MNIIFLTLFDLRSYNEHNIYCDFLRELQRKGHNVYCISPVERRYGEKTHLKEDGKLLKLRIGNTQKTNVIEKGISTLLLERQFITAIKRYFGQVKFDLILYSTPPITLLGAVSYLKKRDNARTYLMLKDIFPQNAVDMGMLSKRGPRTLLYRYFRSKENGLYAVSDRIGCMSPANIQFLLNQNPEIPSQKVELCPNAIEVRDVSLTAEERAQMRTKYQIPADKLVFVYGGNLGKPQGVDFILESLRTQAERTDVFFLIVGDGTEYSKIENYILQEEPQNVKLIQRLPRDDYEKMISACDIGLIYLDHRFTIPNFPSRVLSYMQAKLPVLVCADPCTDIGTIAEENGFGWCCSSDDTKGFICCINAAAEADLAAMGQKAYDFLHEHYTTEVVYNEIKEFFR